MLVEVAAPITTEAAVFTVTEPSGKVGGRVKIKEASATNTTGGALTLDAHVIPSGGSASAGNKVYSALALAAGATVQLTSLINLELSRGDKITMLASGAGVSVNLSGGPVESSET